MTSSIALLNPSARGGKSLRLVDTALAALGPNCQIIHCQSPEQTESQAFAAAQQNVAVIIAVGGDGTIHHAANGLLRAVNSASALAILPSGTANDYWATLKSYATKAKSGELLVDVGEIRHGDFQRCFVNALGIGFTAETAAAAKHFQQWSPRMRYLLGIAESLRSRWSLTTTQVQLDELTPRAANLLLLSIAKGRREGSFTLSPRAQLDDGQFHIVTALDLRRRDVCRYLPGVCIGKLPTTDPRIRFETARRIILKPKSPLRFHLDGELFDESLFEPDCNVEILVRPKRLRIVFPQAFSNALMLNHCTASSRTRLFTSTPN